MGSTIIQCKYHKNMGNTKIQCKYHKNIGNTGDSQYKVLSTTHTWLMPSLQLQTRVQTKCFKKLLKSFHHNYKLFFLFVFSLVGKVFFNVDADLDDKKLVKKG